MKKAFLEVGKIQNTHGIKGDLKAEFWCDDFAVFQSLKEVFYKDKDRYVPLKIERNVPFKDLALIRVEGIESPEEGVCLKNTVIYARREDLPIAEGSFFIADLIGLPVFDEDSEKIYGVLKDISDNSASQIYEIQTEKGMAYLPCVPEFVKSIDLEKGIGVRPIKGIFDED